MIIGVDLGGTKLFGALADGRGEVLAERYQDGNRTTGDERYEMLAGLIGELVSEGRDRGGTLQGITVGAPSVTDWRNGIVRWAPALNWREFPLKARLEARFQSPVFVDNDVNLAALGEHRFGAGRGTRNMALITLGTGVGSGLIVEGALYRGGHDSSGEIGYMLPGREALGKHYDGFGAMESIISGTGIAERGREAVAALKPGAGQTGVSAKDVFEAASRQEEWAVRVVDETVDYLAVMMANLCAVLDPERVLLGGGVAQSADLLIPPLLSRMEGLIPHVPEIRPAALGGRATVMGAIALSMEAAK